MTDHKNIFITGINGYIGGTIAIKLQQNGYTVTGLVRKYADQEALKLMGIKTYIGTLQELNILQVGANEADAIIHTADSDDPEVASNLLRVLKGTTKTLIYTSGSSLAARLDNGEPDEYIYTEDYPLQEDSIQKHRIEINDQIIKSSRQGIRTIVIIPSMVYGIGLGLNKESKQIPMLIKAAKEKGIAVYIGKGENIWSNIHVEDLAELYRNALGKAKAGSIFFAENGQSSFKEIAKSISKKLNYESDPLSISIEDASSYWGADLSAIALGSNCRVSADKARLFLNWKPTFDTIQPFV